MYLQAYKYRLITAVSLLIASTVIADNSGVQSIAGTLSDGSSDVIGVNDKQITAEYWVQKRPSPTELLKDANAIHNFNAHAFSIDPSMQQIAQVADSIAASALTDKILAISKPYKAPLYGLDGNPLKPEVFAGYEANLNLDSLHNKDPIPVQFGLVVKRANMRTFPTDQYYYSTEETKFIDRFQENGLFPGDEVAIFLQSRDRQWVFVQSFNYSAWVRKENIALAKREAIRAYKNRNPFLLITGDKVRTSFNPWRPQVSEVQLDMGIQLPLADAKEVGHSLDGQNPYTSYTVLLPVRDQQGNLKLEVALIPKNKDVHLGYLPFNHEHIIRQAFKFLGERYGWGHSFNARDCTGFVAEVYKTFGLQLPRNSGQQGHSPIGKNIRFDENTLLEEKLNTLNELEPGDLIYTPGHVMMYIGQDDEQPYVIHDVSSFGYLDESGEFYQGTLNSVAVTPFLPLRYSADSRYIDKIYNIKKIK